MNPSFKFGGEDGGPVESDETFVGPNPYKMHKSRKAKVHDARDRGQEALRRQDSRVRCA